MVVKKFNQLESAQKFMQIGMDVTCMHTNFGGRDLSGFRDIVALKNSQFSLSVPWDHGTMVIKKFNRSESARKIHANRDGCHMHADQFWWA